jgi:hypothetical protein
MAAISSSHPQHRHHQPTAAVLAPHHHRRLDLPTSLHFGCLSAATTAAAGQVKELKQYSNKSKQFNSDNFKPFSGTGFEQFNSKNNHSSSQSSSSNSKQYNDSKQYNNANNQRLSAFDSSPGISRKLLPATMRFIDEEGEEVESEGTTAINGHRKKFASSGGSVLIDQQQQHFDFIPKQQKLDWNNNSKNCNEILDMNEDKELADKFDADLDANFSASANGKIRQKRVKKEPKAEELVALDEHWRREQAQLDDLGSVFQNDA